MVNFIKSATKAAPIIQTFEFARIEDFVRRSGCCVPPGILESSWRSGRRESSTAVMIIEPKGGEVKGGGGSGISFGQAQIPEREVCLWISGTVSARKLQLVFGQGEIT